MVDDSSTAGAVERFAAAVVLLAGVPFFVLLLYAMATTSLWTDEIFSILVYSGSGPVRSATYYFDANNHVFFNVLNGCLPWRGTMDPLAARGLSFAAVFGAVTLLFLFLLRRSGLFVAAAAVLVLLTGQELLDLILQARGYGLVSLLALAISILSIRAVEGGSPRVLAGMAAVAVLGVWTVPTFAFFGAPLLLLVFAIRRDRASFLAGLGALAGVLIVYAPIASRMMEVASTYGEMWGRQYGSILAVGETLRKYLFRESWPFSKGVCLFLFGALVALVWLPRREEEVDLTWMRGARLVLTAVVVFFAICRLLETPLIRSTAFITLPLMLVAGLFAGRLFGKMRLRGVVAVVIAVISVGYGVMKTVRFEFVPIQDWLSVGTTIKEVLPPGAQVWVSHTPSYLERHLPAGAVQVPNFDSAAFSDGRLVVADTPLFEHDARAEFRAGLPPSVAFKFPQRQRAYFSLLVTPPSRRSIVAVHDEGFRDETTRLVDRDLGTAGETENDRRLVVAFVPGHRYRSLVLVRRGASTEPGIRIDITALGRRGIPEGAIRHWGEVTFVNLRDLPVERVEITPTQEGAPLPRLREIWAYPL